MFQIAYLSARVKLCNIPFASLCKLYRQLYPSFHIFIFELLAYWSHFIESSLGSVLVLALFYQEADRKTIQVYCVDDILVAVSEIAILTHYLHQLLFVKFVAEDSQGCRTHQRAIWLRATVHFVHIFEGHLHKFLYRDISPWQSFQSSSCRVADVKRICLIP